MVNIPRDIIQKGKRLLSIQESKHIFHSLIDKLNPHTLFVEVANIGPSRTPRYIGNQHLHHSKDLMNHAIKRIHGHAHAGVVLYTDTDSIFVVDSVSQMFRALTFDMKFKDKEGQVRRKQHLLSGLVPGQFKNDIEMVDPLTTTFNTAHAKHVDHKKLVLTLLTQNNLLYIIFSAEIVIKTFTNQ